MDSLMILMTIMIFFKQVSSTTMRSVKQIAPPPDSRHWLGQRCCLMQVQSDDIYIFQENNC